VVDGNSNKVSTVTIEGEWVLEVAGGGTLLRSTRKRSWIDGEQLARDTRHDGKRSKYGIERSQDCGVSDDGEHFVSLQSIAFIFREKLDRPIGHERDVLS
jgi:hypothetical protein